MQTCKPEARSDCTVDGKGGKTNKFVSVGRREELTAKERGRARGGGGGGGSLVIFGVKANDRGVESRYFRMEWRFSDDLAAANK